jgi:hypothetical protein
MSQSSRFSRLAKGKMYSNIYTMEVNSVETKKPITVLIKEGPYPHGRLYNIFRRMFGKVGVENDFARWLSKQTTIGRRGSLHYPVPPTHSNPASRLASAISSCTPTATTLSRLLSA